MMESNVHITKHSTAEHSKQPTVVGIYGISGSGKSHLLSQLKLKFKDKPFIFWEGSEAIDAVVPGGLDQFQKLEHHEQVKFRAAALSQIQDQCREKSAMGVVTGHFMFWEEQDEQGYTVWTKSDQNIFTHIVYLDVPALEIANQRRQDSARTRVPASVGHLDKWKRTEEHRLRDLCSKHDILFCRVFPYPELLSKISDLLCDFRHHTIERNLSNAVIRTDAMVQKATGQLEIMLVVDGDKTLARMDTGELFWNRICTDRLSWDTRWTASAVFKSPLGYSHAAFRQIALLYEEAVNEQEFEDVCDHVAGEVTLYPDFLSLLKKTVKHAYIRTVVVTCGISKIWEKILEREQLSEVVQVIGGGRISDDLVVTPAIKAAVVDRCRDQHGLRVCAFGDSPLDLAMLRAADKAFVIVGKEEERSRSMEQMLTAAIDDGLRACQVLLPPTVSPRLDRLRLPAVSLADDSVIHTIFYHSASPAVQHATMKNTARILMTPTRDARIAGPDLREKHRRCGFYLAVEYLPDMLGVEEYQMPHVQGHSTEGYRFSQEEQTTVVALMRGGEPMAFGINDALPLASLVHAKEPSDLKAEHLEGRTTVLLVDSVINTGKSMEGFLNHVRYLNHALRIIVVAGVIQAEAIANDASLSNTSLTAGAQIVALRVSTNKFKGTGTNDTGNRLFNTTYMH